MNIKELEEKIKSGVYNIVFPKEPSEDAAVALANLIADAAGIAAFTNEEKNDNIIWGVLVEKKGN